MSSRPLFLILDGNALLHRAWHAIPPLTTREGTVVNAVYGFANVIEKLRDEYKPTAFAVAWDLEGKTFRHEKVATYKATRVRKEQELYDQIPMIQEMLSAYRIPSVSSVGFEADDVIATLATAASKKEYDVLIVTGDQDALQLVDDHVEVLYFIKGLSQTKRFDAKAVEEKLGVTPSQLIDYKALRGDTSDNIAGVPGIGEKIASELLREHKTLEGIYLALQRGVISDSVAKKLTNGKTAAFEAKELVTLVRDAKLPITLRDANVQDPDVAALGAFFARMEFRRLVAKYADGSDADSTKTKQEKRDRGSRSSVAVVTDLETWRSQLAVFTDRTVAFLLLARPADLFGTKTFAVAVSDGKTTVASPSAGADELAELASMLGRAKAVTTHGAKRALHAFVDAKVDPSQASKWFDLELAHYLLAAEARTHDLDEVFRFAQISHPAMPTEFAHEKTPHALGQAASACLKAHKELEEQLKKEKLATLFDDLEMPLVPVLFEMERVGIRVDTSALSELSKVFTKEVERLSKKIYALVGREFNINSPSQLSEMLFADLKLPTKGIKKTQQGFSTAAPELDKLADAHPILPLIGDYRELTKLLSTYVETLPALVAKDGRIHTTFQQTVASTGRLSSSDPNLQNIPIKTEIGNRIRHAFVAEKGKVLLAADYAQFELRLAAWIAEDEPFLKAFREGVDIHRRTAAEIWNLKDEDVTDAQRRAAKTLNFGILYGMGPRALARGTGFTQDEARDFLDRYFAIHTGIAIYIDETKALAHAQGYVTTPMGRRRRFPEIHSGVQQVVAAAERMAVNMPIQGAEADIIKKAMIEIAGWMRTVSSGKKTPPVRLLLQVHDELVFEVDRAFFTTAAKAIADIMQTACTLPIPLVVNIEVGDNWGEMESL